MVVPDERAERREERLGLRGTRNQVGDEDAPEDDVDAQVAGGEGVAVDPVAESKRLDQAKAEGKKPNETPVPTIGKGASGGGFLGIF